MNFGSRNFGSKDFHLKHKKHSKMVIKGNDRTFVWNVLQ